MMEEMRVALEEHRAIATHESRRTFPADGVTTGWRFPACLAVPGPFRGSSDGHAAIWERGAGPRTGSFESIGREKEHEILPSVRLRESPS